MFCGTGGGEVLLSTKFAALRLAKAPPYTSENRNTPARWVPEVEHGVTANPSLTELLFGVRTPKFILRLTLPTVTEPSPTFNADEIEASAG